MQYKNRTDNGCRSSLTNMASLYRQARKTVLEEIIGHLWLVVCSKISNCIDIYIIPDTLMFKGWLENYLTMNDVQNMASQLKKGKEKKIKLCAGIIHS